MRNAKRGMDIAFHLICELNFHRIGQINFVIQNISRLKKPLSIKCSLHVLTFKYIYFTIHVKNTNILESIFIVFNCCKLGCEYLLSYYCFKCSYIYVVVNKTYNSFKETVGTSHFLRLTTLLHWCNKWCFSFLRGK